MTCVDWENTAHKNDHLDLTCDLARELPFDDGEFDTIILSEVVEHLPSPESLWTEMSWILGAGGVVVLNVPFYYWIHVAPHDCCRYTEFALRRFAEPSGFLVVD